MSAQAEPLHPVDPDVNALSVRDTALLDFERQWVKHVAAKEEAIRDVFGLSATRYYQVLNALIDSPAAVRHDPMLVKRLHRARDERTHARAARTFTSPRTRSDAPDDRPFDTTD